MQLIMFMIVITAIISCTVACQVSIAKGLRSSSCQIHLLPCQASSDAVWPKAITADTVSLICCESNSRCIQDICWYPPGHACQKNLPRACSKSQSVPTQLIAIFMQKRGLAAPVPVGLCRPTQDGHRPANKTADRGRGKQEGAEV